MDWKIPVDGLRNSGRIQLLKLPEFSSPSTGKTALAKKPVYLLFGLLYPTVYLLEFSSKLKTMWQTYQLGYGYLLEVGTVQCPQVHRSQQRS